MEYAPVLDITRSGNLGGEKVGMALDENSLAHLVSVLTNLYSDPELAVIREYSTNAYDAHVEAGQTRPIEVTTPNALSTHFKVKDYGVGLDVDDIRNIYSKYGASTKRGTNAQVGMLGLGCKSALTYTSQFTIRAVKNGMLSLVYVSITEDGTGEMEIVDHCPTDEPNGVEISIPVKRHNSFESKAKEFFRFWKQGTVLLNGAEPEYISGNRISDNIILVENLAHDYIVMGNVAYPTDEVDELYPDRHWSARYGVVATVDIGDINFTPSRESLHYTTKTKNTLVRIKTEFRENLAQQIQDDIDSAVSHPDAARKYFSWVKTFGGALPVKDVTYKGDEIPRVFTSLVGSVYLPNRDRDSFVKNQQSAYLESLLTDTVIVTGFDLLADSFTHSKRRKLRHWAGNDMPSTFLLCDEAPGKPWTDDVRTVKWEDIVAIKLPRVASTATARKKPVEKFVTFQKGVVVYEDVITSTLIGYLSPTEHYNHSPQRVSSLIPEMTLVSLARNRWDKFKREYPTAEHVSVILSNKLDEIISGLTEDDKMFLSYEYRDRAVLEVLASSGIVIDDPDLKEHVRKFSAGEESERIAPYKVSMELMSTINYNKWTQSKIPTKHLNVIKNYPLIESHDIRNIPKHVQTYINAQYKESNVKV